MIIKVIILLIFTWALYLRIKKEFAVIYQKSARDYSNFQNDYNGLIQEDIRQKKESSILEKELHDTIALYDITKQICKSLEKERVFELFSSHINSYIKVQDCKFIQAEDDLSKYEGYSIMPLKLGNKNIGHLGVSGVSDEDKDKFNILGQQFLLGFKRAYFYEKIQELAITDTLTQAFSRKYCFERLQEELERSRKMKYQFSLLMVDIDNFKDINDHYGHLVGDAILREISKAIRDNSRQIDLVGRYGGEEFLIILTETDSSKAKFAAERIREAVRNKRVNVYDEAINVSISVGISTFRNDAKDAKTMIDRADKALYRAKDSGRDKVCVYDDSCV